MLFGVSKALGHFFSPVVCSGREPLLSPYLLAGVFYCNAFHFLLSFTLGFLGGLCHERCLPRREMRSIRVSERVFFLVRLCFVCVVFFFFSGRKVKDLSFL